MAQILVRQLDDELKVALQRRARKHGRSTEEEVREILRAAVLPETGEAVNLGTAIADEFREEGEIRGLQRTLLEQLQERHALPDGDPKAAIERLQPLTASGHPWRASALDLTAAAKLKSGDRGGALEIYKQLADDLSAPRGLRARAAEMAAALKS